MLGCTLVIPSCQLDKKSKRYSCTSAQLQLTNCYNTPCLIDILCFADCANAHKKIAKIFSLGSK